MNLYILEHNEPWSSGTLVVAAASVNDVTTIIMQEYNSGKIIYPHWRDGVAEISTDIEHLMQDKQTIDGVERYVRAKSIVNTWDTDVSGGEPGVLVLVREIKDVNVERGIISDTYHSG